ncbi:Polypeptide N-acetylgalactosaminyltransferase 1 [Blattella germanica]|nr:Polypeptide N-acetylgalactosaminyltransferase 1 [Blattella germanica]
MRSSRVCRVAVLLLCLTGSVVLWLSQRLNNALTEEDLVARRVRQLRNVTNSKYELQLREDEARQVPGLGDRGVAVNLQGEEQKLAEKLIPKEAFNILLSDKIPYTRTVPDARNPRCRDLTYDSELPTASVVIIFTNEAWSSLIRTVHSVLNGSPANLLKEIILVDDCSTREELGGKLDYYLETRLPSKVKLIRLKERAGLIRARLAGAKIATGDVLVFLDAHCEVVVSWLEPLLQRIKEKRTAVLVPIIDVIDDKTFEYMYSKSASDFFQVGGFTWSGHFTWVTVPEEEQIRRGTPVSPTRSPTMAGGLFAIERNYFWEIGSYDNQMDVWGGENLEMSFRVWQCGGTLETIPCSRVGHIFRSFHPYKFPGGKDTHGINTARMVEVWMDEYKELFYLYRPDLKFFSLSTSGELRRENHCAEIQNVAANPVRVIMFRCHGQRGNQEWKIRSNGQIVNLYTGLCLDAFDGGISNKISAAPCSGSVWQHWKWSNSTH